LRSDGEGLRFTCRLGVRNYWSPIHIRGETVGIAYLQALADQPRKVPARKRPAHAGATVLTTLQFTWASRFLQHLVQHAQTASLADLRKADLTNAGRVVVVLEKEQARLHDTLKRHLPAKLEARRRSGPESHAEQVVLRLLERIDLDCGKAITLRSYAREVSMNASYLSDLFSRSVGRPFKTYLTELRVEKSKPLLGDTAMTVSDVAYAVGYTSENRFRAAFKHVTGLSPKAWRETMQTSSQTPAR
jgi:AraC-like DNA-binding protein